MGRRDLEEEWTWGKQHPWGKQYPIHNTDISIIALDFFHRSQIIIEGHPSTPRFRQPRAGTLQRLTDVLLDSLAPQSPPTVLTGADIVGLLLLHLPLPQQHLDLWIASFRT